MIVYVAIYPRSNSNPTPKFRVAKQKDWQRYLDGDTKSYAFTTFDTYDEAVAERDRLNAEQEKLETQAAND